MARDGYLPRAFEDRGRRLVYSIGIIVLCLLSGGLLVVFGGITDRLIPLFAVGALSAFTLSQSGMVLHWRHSDEAKARRKMWVNLVGALCTGIALLVVLAAKFTEGAWITLIIVGALIVLFFSVKRHYDYVARVTAYDKPLDASEQPRPIVVVPIMGWTAVTAKALRFAMSISEDVTALHVSSDEPSEHAMRKDWEQYVRQPLEHIAPSTPSLSVVRSAHRRLLHPILTFLVRTRHDHPDRFIVVVIPELVEPRWYQYFLHSQKATVLKAALLFRGGSHVVVVNVPWYVDTKK